jgi:carbamoyl-phosphate synthase large subunit
MSFNILITAASRRVPLVLAFREGLKSLGNPGAVIATDVNPMSPAVHFCDRAYRVPLSSDPGYLAAIRTICEGEQIGLIVPTIDDELPLFGAAVADFADRGVRVAASPEATALVCDDKYATCCFLRTAGVAAAESLLPAQLPKNPYIPAFVKPRRGRGSVFAFPARSAKELAFFVTYVPDPVVQEYLDGPEFTIDVMCDFSGRPISIVPRQRVVIRAGVIDRGCTVNDPALIDLAMACASAMVFVGPINIQCRTVNGRPTVFEINARFSGGIPLTIEAGAHFPRMLIQLALGQQVEPVIGQFRDGLWMSNYESSLFFPPEHLDRLRTLDQAGQHTAGEPA